MTTVKRITIFGGTGFLGRYVIAKLAHDGHLIRVATRSVEQASFLKPYGNLGQITPIQIDWTIPSQLTDSIAGSDCVINLIGILSPHGRSTFAFIHTELPELLAKIAAKVDVPRFIHISALGVHNVPTSAYATSKAAGEKAVCKAFEGAILVRPSVIIGPEDNFLNRYAQMARLLPIVPIIGSGHNRMQPVYVGDVAQAIRTLVNLSEIPSSITQSGLDLGGPQVYTFKELCKKTLHWCHRSRPTLSIPFGLAKVMGAIMQLFPEPAFTPDNVELLKHDNVLSGKTPGFETLDIQPTNIESIAPTYLKRYQPRS